MRQASSLIKNTCSGKTNIRKLFLPIYLPKSLFI